MCLNLTTKVLYSLVHDMVLDIRAFMANWSIVYTLYSLEFDYCDPHFVVIKIRISIQGRWPIAMCIAHAHASSTQMTIV